MKFMNDHCCYFPKGLPDTNSTVMVFLHGFGGSHRHWLPLLEYLDEACIPVLVDFRGHGRSQVSVSDELTDYVADIYKILRRYNLSKINVVAHSFGGLVAQAFCLEYHSVIDKLILLSTAANVMIHPNLLVQLRSGNIDSQFVLGCVSGESKEKLEKVIVDGFKEMNFDDGKFDTEKITGINLITKVHAIECPVLVVYGDIDKVVSPRRTRLLAKMMPNSLVQELVNVGHYPHLEAPKIVGTLCNDFLK